MTNTEQEVERLRRDLQRKKEGWESSSRAWSEVLHHPEVRNRPEGSLKEMTLAALDEVAALRKKRDAVREYGEKMLNANGMSWCSMHGRSLLAILDTDEQGDTK